MTPAVSVIIPFRRGGPQLDECLAHLEFQTFAEFEVILVPDDPAAFAGARVHVMPSGPALPNRKRQIGSAAGSAPIVAFIDDDAYPDPGWLAAALPHFADPNVVAVGGPAVTPPDDPPRARASGAIYAARIVTATTRRRYVPETACDVDALPSCNLLIRRDAFLRDVEASAGYWPGEDILVCLLATQHGERIVYDPAVLVYHHRRNVFAAHLRQVWNYGRFRGFFIRRYARTQRNLAYAAPAVFALAHAALPAALSRPRLRAPVLVLAGAYAALAGWSAWHEARNARANPWLVAAGIYLTHLTYGCASVAGWLFGVPSRENEKRPA